MRKIIVGISGSSSPIYGIRTLAALADVNHDPHNMAASVSSGSFKTDGMVVVPCSMKTLSGIANSYSTDLLTRAADVCLKERRPLVVVARETPLHRGHLLNMLTVTDMGGIILPPIPGFYARPKTIADLVDHTVGKILDALGVDNETFKRWEGENAEE